MRAFTDQVQASEAAVRAVTYRLSGIIPPRPKPTPAASEPRTPAAKKALATHAHIFVKAPPRTPAAKKAPADDPLKGEARVLALFIRHPDWTDTQLAKVAGVARTSLYRMPRFMQAKCALKQQGRDNYRRRLDVYRGLPDGGGE